MKKMMLAFLFMLCASQARALVIEGTLVDRFDHYYISWSGGTFTAEVIGTNWTDGLTGNGLDDPTAALYTDDGSSGSLTGSLVDFSWSNWSIFPSISVINLAAGDYVFSMGTFLTMDLGTGYIDPDKLRNVFQYQELRSTGDYQVTFSEGTSLHAVPEPTSLALMGLGLAGLVMLRRKQKTA